MHTNLFLVGPIVLALILSAPLQHEAHLSFPLWVPSMKQ
jgi:hypothetical protein